MAFTEPEKVKIRFYLGWSARFHQFDSSLEQAISAVEAEADTEAFVRDDLLVALDDVRTKLTDAHSRLKALKVGSIDLPKANEVMLLRAEGARHANSLAATMGVSVRHNIFGSSRYRSFATHGGGYFKHG